MSFSTAPSGGDASSGTERIDTRRLWPAALVAAAAAAVVNVVIRAIAVGPLDVSSDFPPLESVANTIIASVVGAIAGAVVLALLARFTRRPLRTFWIVAGVFLLASLAGPFGQSSEPGGDATAVGTLIAMHIVTAAIVVGVLTAMTRKS